METTPIRKRETELNPRRGSARLHANRFAPLQTVDRPKPGKLRDQDGRQAGCVRKHVLPSRFLIGLSRASDEPRRKGLLNPSDPQLLRGRLARRGRLVGRGRLARHPPRRRPSELAPLGPATGGASPPGEPSRIAPRTWGRLPRRTAKDDGTTRRRDDRIAPSPPWERGGRFLVVPSTRRPVVLPPRKGATSPALGQGRRDDRTTGSPPPAFGTRGTISRRPVSPSSRRPRGAPSSFLAQSSQGPRRDCVGTV